MANEFHICVIKLAKYEELRPAAYGVIANNSNVKLAKAGLNSSYLASLITQIWNSLAMENFT